CSQLHRGAEIGQPLAANASSRRISRYQGDATRFKMGPTPACAQGKTPMKLRASRIERMLAKVEATLVPPPRKWLRVIIDEAGEAEAQAVADASPDLAVQSPIRQDRLR